MFPFHFNLFGNRLATTFPVVGATVTQSSAGHGIALHHYTAGLPLRPANDEIVFPCGGAQIRCSGGRVGEIALGGQRALPARPQTLAALGCLLQQQGALVLHATAVGIGDSAVLLAGRSGLGKSSLAAALVRKGHGLIGDDLTCIDLDDEGATVRAGLPSIALWPHLAASLEIEPNELVPDGSRKPLWTPPVAAPPPGLPVAAICVLERGHKVALSRLTGANAFEVLVSNTYPTAALANDGYVEAHFHACVRLAGCGKVLKLVLPDPVDGLQTTCHRVVETVHSLTDDSCPEPVLV